MKIQTIILSLLIFSACSTPTTKEESPEQPEETKEEAVAPPSMIGKWDSRILRVVKPTVNNTEVTEIVDANPDNYEEVIGLKTAIVYFHEDSSYKEEYILPDGSIAYEQSGKWFIDGDSLTTVVYGKDIREYKYHFEIRGDSAIFRSLMDYDADGQRDDEFYGVSIKDSNY